MQNQQRRPRLHNQGISIWFGAMLAFILFSRGPDVVVGIGGGDRAFRFVFCFSPFFPLGLISYWFAGMPFSRSFISLTGTVGNGRPTKRRNYVYWGATPLPPLPFFVRRPAEGMTGRTTSKVSPFLKRAIGRPYCGLRFVDAVVVSHCLLFCPLVVECFRTMLSFNAFVQGHLLSLSTGCENVDYNCQSSVGDYGTGLGD